MRPKVASLKAHISKTKKTHPELSLEQVSNIVEQKFLKRFEREGKENKGPRINA